MCVFGIQPPPPLSPPTLPWACVGSQGGGLLFALGVFPPNTDFLYFFVKYRKWKVITNVVQFKYTRSWRTGILNCIAFVISKVLMAFHQHTSGITCYALKGFARCNPLGIYTNLYISIL